jgi:GTP pyrophosphokinase
MLEGMPTLIWELDPDFRLYGRIKSIVSIWNKMLNNGHDVGQVRDIIGLRAIIRHPRDCYRLIQRVHSEFQVVASGYDDYIAAPKLNGYRSIHTTVLSPCGFAVEIQVRTHAMHEICERGSAAHAAYKRPRIAWTSLIPRFPRLVTCGRSF